MQVNYVKVENFASYKELEFTFDDQGLVLIEGPTGSGKSTLCDVIPWVLFGRTAKGGTVDEVLTWPGKEVCKGECQVGYYIIVRTRGPKAKDNDLYFIHATNEIPCRGKDLQDTQKKINDILGMDYDLYLSGSYFHEFSQTAQFFTTTAKNRRAICEQLVDLSLAKKVQLGASADKKQAKIDVLTAEGEYAQNNVHYQYVETNLKRGLNAKEQWDRQHVIKVANMTKQDENFSTRKAININILKQEKDLHLIKKAQAILSTKQQIEALGDINSPAYHKTWGDRLKRIKDTHKFEACPTCGGDKDHKFLAKLAADEKEYNEKRLEDAYKWKELERLEQALETLQVEDDSFDVRIKKIQDEKNTYGTQLDALLSEENPHAELIEQYKRDLSKSKTLKATLTDKLETLKQKLSDLELLSGITENFRGEVVRNTIMSLEDRTNDLLTNYFDGEIKINLTIDADKVDVSILKDGNQASYTQLSKGQRQLLKLSFGIAVMQTIANHHSIDFRQLMLDEALDGLDDNMKMKAVNMLQTLALDYDTIYIVEHSEGVKAMVDQKITVSLVNGESIIEKTF